MLNFSISNHLLIHGCWLVCLLLYVAFQIFHQKQKYLQFDTYKYKSRIIVNWLQSSQGRVTCLEWLLPLGKSSASLGRGLGEKHLMTNGVAWRPVNHTGAAQWGVGSWYVAKDGLTNCVGKGGWSFHPVSPNGFLSRNTLFNNLFCSKKRITERGFRFSLGPYESVLGGPFYTTITLFRTLSVI